MQNMDGPIRDTIRVQAAQVIRGLESRFMEGYFCESAQEAKQLALDLIAPDEVVAWGGSATLQKLQMREALIQRDQPILDRTMDMPVEERREVMRKALTADVFLMSSNAITLDGELVNIDGIGNRVAALCFGPRKVILIVGINKLATDVDAAIKRVHQVACAANSIRYGGKTPCAVTGKCASCKKDSLCAQIVVTRLSQDPGRVKVILVGEPLGF